MLDDARSIPQATHTATRAQRELSPMPRISPKRECPRCKRVQRRNSVHTCTVVDGVHAVALNVPERVQVGDQWRAPKATGEVITLAMLKAFAEKLNRNGLRPPYAADRGARGVAASAQPTETQTAARESAAADGGTCQANTDAAQPQSFSDVGSVGKTQLPDGGAE